jgi:S1-C subfamily serine protease
MKLNDVTSLVFASALMTLSSPFAAQADQADPALAGASPGERAAIEALCEPIHSATYRSMCKANQVVGILKTGRKPDLSIAPAALRMSIDSSCGGIEIPADRFACERKALAGAGLTVRDEPGAGALRAQGETLASANQPIQIDPDPLTQHPDTQVAKFAPDHRNAQVASAPAPLPPNQDHWLTERPTMPVASEGPVLPATDLYAQVAPSIYLVKASDGPVELAERTGYTQGSAVAITDRILLTNCHVVLGHRQIALVQKGVMTHATLVYADREGDRCYLQSTDTALRPVRGVRRFADLKVGETVFSLGAPEGYEQTLGQGMVSGLRQFAKVRMVQNSAPTWFGSSGGGLFDAHGNLVGITTAVDTRVANLNFSIAAEDFWL